MCSTDHEGEIRLVAGKHQYEGRLEVCLYRPEYSLSLWGTFCVNGWDLEETVVACRQLGVPANSKQTITATDISNDFLHFSYYECFWSFIHWRA